jgi:hypothetical protein
MFTKIFKIARPQAPQRWTGYVGLDHNISGWEGINQ